MRFANHSAADLASRRGTCGRAARGTVFLHLSARPARRDDGARDAARACDARWGGRRNRPGTIVVALREFD